MKGATGPVVRALREAGHDVVTIVEVARGATDEQVLERALNAVSYTHLTLPTICSV